MTGHVDAHNDLRDRILAEGKRLGVSIDIGGPYVVGDPGHIQEHNKTRAALEALAAAASVEVTLPVVHKIGDHGHAPGDHDLMEAALAAIEKAEPPRLTIVHTDSFTFTITDYNPKLTYNVEGFGASLDVDTLRFQSRSDRGKVIVRVGTSKVALEVERRDYTYHDEHVPYQSCYNPCGNCRTDVTPHSWTCGCGSPCNDDGGGQWGDCICHGPGYDIRVKDPTPAGFEDSFGEWGRVAPPGSTTETAPSTVRGRSLDLWLEIAPQLWHNLDRDLLELYREGELVALYSTGTDAPELRFAELEGRSYLRLTIEDEWVVPGIEAVYRAHIGDRELTYAGGAA